MAHHLSSPQRQRLLSLQLVEVDDCARKYIRLFDQLFTLPSEASEREDALLYILIDMKVLMEEWIDHAQGLHEQAGLAADEIDPD